MPSCLAIWDASETLISQSSNSGHVYASGTPEADPPGLCRGDTSGLPLTKIFSYHLSHAQEQRHVIRLANGMRVTDKDVARAELERIRKRIEREAVGLTPDPFIVAAGLSFRVAIARFARHLRRRRVTRKRLVQVVHNLKWLAESAPLTRLADFNEERIDVALGKLADSDRSPRTANAYRRNAHTLGE